jgi:hypothetical protein
MKNTSIDPSILEYALSALQADRIKIDTKITEIQALLGRRTPGRPKRDDNVPEWVQPKATRKTTATGRRKLSPEARQRMAEAQRRRWAGINKAKKAEAKAELAATKPPKKTAPKKNAAKRTVAKKEPVAVASAATE